MARRLTREKLGPKFTEGHRRVWQAIERLGLAPNEAGAKLGFAKGSETHFLYGDRGASRRVARAAREEFGIPDWCWEQPPSREFVPPAARAA